MKMCIKLILLLSMSLPLSPSFANFDSALKLYEKNNYPEAFYAFKNLAYIGDKSSQFNLGVMYLRGEYVETDLIEAFAWISLASEGGDQNFQNTKKNIFSHFSSKDKKAAANLANEYLSKYGKEVLLLSLAPKPLADDECEKGPIRIKKVKAKYPKELEYTGQLGYADIVFNVSSQGYARDINVRMFTDPEFFKSSALSLIKSRWQTEESNGLYKIKYGIEYRYTYAGFRHAKYDSWKFAKNVDKALSLAEQGGMDTQYDYAQILQTARIFKDQLKKIDVEYKDSNEWYLRSAQQGHPLAQYELGKNMLRGKGCEVDRDTGLKWLRAAASSGHPYAQEEIAMSAISDGVSDVQRAILWLRKAASSDIYAPKLFLAWELAANPSPEIRDGQEALRLLAAKPEYYFDPVRVYETKAAAYAEAGDYEAAIKWQKKALKKAARLKWDIAVMADRLTAYTSSSSWQGEYHVPESLERLK